jgi:hypothetical protein
MVLTIVDDLGRFANLPPKIQDRIKRAQDIYKLDYTRRTRQQEAFLASVEDELERGVYDSVPTTASGRREFRPVSQSVVVNFPTPAQEVAYRIIKPDPTKPKPTDYISSQYSDDELEAVNEFTTPLYPPNPEFKRGYITEVNADYEPPLYRRRNLSSYSQDPASAGAAPQRSDVPRRLQTEYDRQMEALIDEFSDQLRSTRAPAPTSASVGDTLYSIYDNLLSRRGVALSGSDLPPELMRAGANEEVPYIRASDDKGRASKKSVIPLPSEIDLAKELSTAAAAQPGLVTQLNLPPYLDSRARQGILRSPNRPYASKSFDYATGESLYDAGITDRVQKELPSMIRALLPGDTPSYTLVDRRLTDQYVAIPDPVTGRPTYRVESPRYHTTDPDPTRYSQIAGWAGVPTGSGATQTLTTATQKIDDLKNQYDYAKSVFVKNTLSPNRTQASANERLDALRQMQSIKQQIDTLQGRLTFDWDSVATESGPEYLARVNQSRAVAQATETANRALRDQIARERIALDREEAASLGQTETIIQPVQPGSLTREEAAEGAFDEYADAINASLRVNPKGDILAPGLFSLGSGSHNLTQRTLIRQTPEGPVSVVGVPDNAGLSYPAGLTPVLQNPISLRTQSVSYRPGAFYRDTSTKPVQSDLVGTEETIEGQSEVALRPSVLAFDVNPEDPGGLPQGEFGRRLFKPGDPLQFSTQVSKGQAALEGQMQGIIDRIAAPTVVRSMRTLAAVQPSIDYLDEQLTRLEPYVKLGRQISASTPGKTKNNEYNIYFQQADNLRQQRQQLASLLRDYEELEVAKERFDQNLSAASNLAISPRSAETVTGLTADGQEVTVPLQDFMKDQRAQPTVSRFGIPLQSQGPRAIPGDASGKYFEYGNPDAVSIVSDWDKPVFQALVAADPTITPNQVRRGVQWRQIRVPNSKAVKIEVINPGVPVTDASGALITYNPTQLVGYDSQVGPYVERKLPDNIESNRQMRQERLAAGREGYTPPPISPNIPIKYNPARPGYPFALPEMRRTAYTPTPEPTSGSTLPLSLEAGRLSPAIPGPNLPLNPGSQPAPRLQPAGVLRYQDPSATRSGRSTPFEDQIADLSQVDSLSAADPAGRNTLFNLANSLGITGTSLMDSSNDFGRLKDDIKATLTARYPDRFARNAQTFVTRLPADLSDPKDIQASIARSIDGRVETIRDPEKPQATTTRYVPGYQVEQLKFQNLDPSQVMLGPGQDDSRLSQYALPAITARMRQNPQTAQNIFSYIENETRNLDSSIARNQAAAQRLSDLLNSPDQLRAALAGSRNPDRDIANIQNSLRDFESEISRSTAYRQNLASNSEAIRRMLGY